MPRTSDPRTRLMAELRDANNWLNAEKKKAQNEYDEATKDVRAEFEAVYNPAEREYREAVAAAKAKFEATAGDTKAKYMEASSQHETERLAKVAAIGAEADKKIKEAYDKYDKTR